MTAQPPDEPFGSLFDDPELEAVFARSSPADTLAAVLTEARAVLAEVDSPLDAELWGSDILAALGSRAGQADEIVSAAEQAGTPEALATLRVLGAVGSGSLRAAASAAAVYRGENPYLGSALLHHADPNLINEHYNRATGLSASENFHQIVRQYERKPRGAANGDLAE